MLTIDIPAGGKMQLEHLILDFNGTIAKDGKLLDGIGPRLIELANHINIHVLTADTHGSAAKQVQELPCRLAIIPSNDQTGAKQDYLRQLSPSRCAAIGNGTNDRLLLHDAVLGIAVMQNEGVALPTLLAADIVVTSCLDALDLLLKPLRLIASLRN